MNTRLSKHRRINDKMLHTLGSLVHDYISFISHSYKIGEGYISTKGIRHFGFVQANPPSVLKALISLYFYIDNGHHRYKFLDIGCGIGNIVLLARHLGFNAYGLEYNRKICNIARKLVGEHYIFKGDMTEFGKYSEYDILYYFYPMADEAAMKGFAEKLAREMKPGAYVIPYGGYNPLFKNSRKFKRVKLLEVDSVVFRKKV